MSDDLSAAIALLDQAVPDPSRGLPDEVFYYISRTTPLVNVDLLIKDEGNRTLLSWRDDPLAGRGWHLPGGIIRYKETMVERVLKVAEIEVRAPVSFDPRPVAIHQIIVKEYPVRGHFISVLFNCAMPATFVPDNGPLVPTDPGYLRWHDSCPDDLLAFHEIYRERIDQPPSAIFLCPEKPVSARQQSQKR